MAEPTKIELEKVLDYTGIKADTVEDFQEQFSKKYLTEEQIFKDKEVKDRIFGRAFGSVTTNIKQQFDEDGIELTGDDLKQPLEAVVKLGREKWKAKFEAEKLELQKTAGLTTDEKLKEINENLTKAMSKNKTLEDIIKTTKIELETERKNSKDSVKNFQLSTEKKDAIQSILWLPDKDEYSRKGFLVELDELYYFDFNEAGEKALFDRKTGNEIKAEGSHSTFMTPSEVYQRDAVKKGMMAINKKAGTPPPNKGTPPPTPPGTPPVKQSGVRPRANTSFKLGS